MNSPIVFLTFTLHQKIADGEWVVIGNSQIVQNIEFPEFKIDVMENRKIHCMVMNFKGEIIREATEDEARNLENKKSYTPSVLEDAVKAKCGVLPWNPSYNELLYKRRK